MDGDWNATGPRRALRATGSGSAVHAQLRRQFVEEFKALSGAARQAHFEKQSDLINFIDCVFKQL
jgi:hypothetical protein